MELGFFRPGATLSNNPRSGSWCVYVPCWHYCSNRRGAGYRSRSAPAPISFPYTFPFFCDNACFSLGLFIYYIVYKTRLVRPYQTSGPANPDTIASTAVRLYQVHVSTPSQLSFCLLSLTWHTRSLGVYR